MADVAVLISQIGENYRDSNITVVNNYVDNFIVFHILQKIYILVALEFFCYQKNRGRG